MSYSKTLPEFNSPKSKNVKSNEVPSLRSYLEEIGKVPLLTEEEEIELIKRAQAGEQDATYKIISSNLRFVVKIAREYQNRGLALSDLISEGNMGLMRALESFDPQRALRFITYAVWWVRQSILQALYNKGHLVRLPQSQQNHARGLRRNIEQQEHQANNSSNADELAERLEISRDSHSELAELLLRPQSIDAPFERDSSESLIDILPDESVLSPDVELSAAILRYELRAAVRVLDDGERCCLEWLYALGSELGSEAPLTVDEVAKRLSVPRNRVRQIRDTALVKLRRNKKIAESLQEHL